MGIALGTPCEEIMCSFEPDGFVPVEGAMGEQLDTKSSTTKEFTNTLEKEYRPATCPLTKNDSKCHANFKEHFDLKSGGFRKVSGEKFNQRPSCRVVPRPHSSALASCGSSTRRPASSSSPQDNSSSSSVFVNVSSLRVEAPNYRPAGDTGSFTDAGELNNETWQQESADTSSRPSAGAAAGEAAPGASNAYAVPRWVEVAWEERPDVFWEAVEHFFAHGAWPPYSAQPASVAELCEGQHATPQGPEGPSGLRGFAPIWVFLLREDDERVFRAAVDFYFECGRFPELTFMPPSFVAMCEGMAIGEFDFYE